MCKVNGFKKSLKRGHWNTFFKTFIHYIDIRLEQHGFAQCDIFMEPKIVFFKGLLGLLTTLVRFAMPLYCSLHFDF